MSYETGYNSPEFSAPRSVVLDAEQLAPLAQLLVPLEVRQLHPNMDYFTLRLMHEDPTDGRSIEVKLISQAALPTVVTKADDGRLDMLIILVDDPSSGQGPVQLLGGEMEMSQMKAETSFHEILLAGQHRYTQETEWAGQALKALENKSLQGLIDAMAALRRSVPANSTVLDHQVASQYTWLQTFMDGTNVSVTVSKGWMEPSLYALDEGIITATMEAGNSNFFVRFGGGEITDLRRDNLGVEGELHTRESGLIDETAALAMVHDMQAALTTARHAGFGQITGSNFMS